MRLTKRQEDEISFMEGWGVSEKPFIATEEEKEQYIEHSVHGRKANTKGIYWETNRLLLAKRGFDMTLKMWRQDLPGGSSEWPLITKGELMEDFSHHPFLVKVLNSI